MSPRLATVVVFGTSFCILVLEILAGRLLAPIVGVSLETFTGIIGTILAGIALGNAAGGRLADEFDPAGLIGPSFILGGALAWVSPVLAGLLDPVPGAGPLTIVALTTVLFLAPATVLSAITPMVAKLRLQSLDESGTVVGNLSAAGTAGALAGTFVTGFVLVGAFGTRAIIVAVGGVLVLSGLALTVWARMRVGPVPIGVAVLVGFGALVMPQRCSTETSTAAWRSWLTRPALRGGACTWMPFATPMWTSRIRSISSFATCALLPGDRLDGTTAVFHTPPRRAAFTFPGYLAARDPAMEQLVLEVDGELVEYVDRELAVRSGNNIDVSIGDARMTITSVPDTSVEVVVGDAFSGRTVPWHLTTRQFVAEVDRY